MGFSPSNRGWSEATDYVALLSRRWRVIVYCVALGLGLAAGYLVFAPKTYTSTASLLVTPTAAESAQLANGRTDSLVNLDTEAQLVKSTTVASRVKVLLGSSARPESLVEDVTVTVPPNTNVLEVSYEGATPQAARQGAHAFAKAYLAARSESAQADIDRQIEGTRQQISRLENELEKLSDRAAALASGSAERQYTDSQQQILLTRIQDLNEQLGPLVAADASPGRIISDAALPEDPTAPLPALFFPSGVMAGLLIGLVAAVSVDRLDRRLLRSSDVERAHNLPVLLDVPAKGRQGPAEVMPATSKTGQAFHQLSHSLRSVLGEGNHVILVSSASPGRGASMVTANLAAALARIEPGTVLVCADPDATSTSLLGVATEPGLEDALLHGWPPASVEQRPPKLLSLRIVPPGANGNLSELLQRDVMREALTSLRGTAKYVIVEAPPTSSSADAQALAALADAAVVIAEASRTRGEQLSEGVRQLDHMGAAVLGAVVVPTQKKRRAEPAQKLNEEVAAGDSSGVFEAVGRNGSAPGSSGAVPDSALTRPTRRLRS